MIIWHSFYKYDKNTFPEPNKYYSVIGLYEDINLELHPYVGIERFTTYRNNYGDLIGEWHGDSCGISYWLDEGENIMQIGKPTYKPLMFKDIEKGVAFYQPDHRILFMKVEGVKQNGECYIRNAVAIKTGELMSFDNDDIVEIANVHIKDD